jgi:hypothetical protein
MTVLVIALAGGALLAPSPASAASCADHATQADAQRAADTRDADGDGIYCESLPCPCLESGTTSPPPPPPPPSATAPRASCVRPSTVQRLRFSAARYPNIKAHTDAAIAKGWPRVLVLNRPGADERRDRLLADIPTRAGFDRDEYPPAVGRGRANGTQRGLIRGINPLGWLADVMYVASGENRSHGSVLGARLRHFCNGTRFRYAFD